MATIARTFSRASGTQVDVETLKMIVMFCAAGLVVSLLLAGGVAHLPLEPHPSGLDVLNWI
jgi:hypothetical protein